MHAWFISQYITFRPIGGNKHKCRAIHFCYVHILEGGRKKNITWWRTVYAIFKSG